MNSFNVCDRTITSDEIFALLSRYRLMPQLMRELIIDQELTAIDYTPADLEVFRQALGAQGAPELDEDALVRSYKLQRFKQSKWQHHLQSHFLQRKAQLDQVVYSMIRTQDEGLAYELYFRIQENEQTFAEAAVYGEGPESITDGRIGPVELGSLNPGFARLLATRQVGQLMLPVNVKGCFLVLRVEAKIPAQFNEATQQRLLDELFEDWMQERLSQALAQVPVG